AGITVPVQAGIMPLVKKSHVDKTIGLSGAKLPGKISRMIARFYDDPDSLMAAGIAYATDQIADLLSAGARGVHLYVMNNAYVARTITNNVSSILASVNR
ncbi:MAG TPA: methylenetetrahydrofolate reductase, partial [Candidatus Protoclostridium stercorigallinarum]|nr:methylenetetrahydrofolate reductase [Candidatus Protoclostridium stercorigallinarum]